MNRMTLAGILGLATLAGTASGQFAGNHFVSDGLRGSLFINEIWKDPNDGDAEREYIELYYCDGELTLNGLMLCIVNSYTDDNGTPNDDTDDFLVTEVDESFIIPPAGANVPTYKTNSEGIFVLWNSGDDRDVDAIDITDSSTGGYQDDMAAQAAGSDIYCALDTAVRQTVCAGTGLGALSTRYEISFDECGTDGTGGAGDRPGQIANEGSLTFLLIDLPGTTFVAGSVTDLHKDRNPDGGQGVNGYSAALGGTYDFSTSLDGVFDVGPLQIIDSFAMSDQGGKEYAYDEQEEWDFSTNFNPDGFVRLGNTTGVPNGSSMITDGVATEEYRFAYLNWAAGEITGNGTLSNIDFDGGDADERGFGGVPENVGGTADATSYELGSSNDFTPGAVNETMNGQGPLPSCAPRPGDFNNDGVVDIQDIRDAINAQDSQAFIEAINNYQR